MKQSKLRRRRVWRYALLYFTLLVVFLALIVGPIVAGSKIKDFTKNVQDSLSSTGPLSNLFQPVGLNNNDTRGTNHTGTGAVSSAAPTASSTVAARLVKLF